MPITLHVSLVALCVDRVSGEHNSPWISGFPVYGEHLGFVRLPTFRQTVVDYKSFFIASSFFGKRTLCNVMLCHERAIRVFYTMFKIEVFNALQNMPLSKQPFKMQPQFENADVTWSPQYIMPDTRTNKRRAFPIQEEEVRWLILISSHCIGNMYHIIHAQV